MKYTLFDKCFITLDENNIVHDIFNGKLDKHYKRIGSGKKTFICGQTMVYTDIIIYDSIEILKKANNLYDYSIENCGLYTEYHYNGKLKMEYFHNNGIKEGLYKEYNYNGLLIKECNYVNGNLNGIYKTYFTDGKLQIETTYKNNKIHGEYIENYNNSNRIYIKCNFYEGIREGDFIEEQQNNIIKSIYEKNLIVELISINKNTNIINEKRYKHVNYNENNLICCETYYESGNIKEKYFMNLHNRHDKYCKYYESGQKQIECMYNNGHNIDDYYQYYESGRICQYSKYEFNKIIENISYYDRDVNNIKSKQIDKKYEHYKDDGILDRFNYDNVPNISIKYLIESHYYEKNKETHKEILREFALKLLKSLE